jgi:hypothetical protein
MEHKEYEELTDGLMKKAMFIEHSKRPAYTVGSADVLANFKRVGERTELAPEKVAMIYFLKHIDSIQSMVVKQNQIDPEPMDERFCDAINYLRLLYALLYERELGKEIAAVNDGRTNKPEEAV